MASSLCPSNYLLIAICVQQSRGSLQHKCSRIDSVDSAVDSEIWINSDPNLLEDVASEKALSYRLRSISRATGTDGKPPASFVSFGSALSEGQMLNFLGCQPFLVLRETDNLSEVINKCHCLPWSVRLFKKKLPGGDSRLGCNLDHTQLIFSGGGVMMVVVFLRNVHSTCVLKQWKKRWKRGSLILLWHCFFIPVSWYIYTSFIAKEGGVTPYLYWTGISILAGSFTFLYGQEKSISALKWINVIDFGGVRAVKLRLELIQ